jgi:RNA polymerase sigma-70 factor (ECF subfamily)
MLSTAVKVHPLLLQRVARGDADAVRDCIRRFGPLVWSLARRYVGVEAEDAVQEVFVDLWRSAERYDPNVASEVAFVSMIARRRLIDRRRAVGRRPRTQELDEAPTAVHGGSERIEACGEAVLAAKVLAQLRPEQRDVLVLGACHGMSHQEIAESLGIPLGTVKAHARRALMRVREALVGSADLVPEVQS